MYVAAVSINFKARPPFSNRKREHRASQISLLVAMLNNVLPSHPASSGVNGLAVWLKIEQEADVNA